MATYEGTWAYRDRFHESFARTYFRPFGDLALSSIGVGTYLGDPTDEADSAYREAIVAALESGINVLDTAINYRHQRSERVVGAAIGDSEIDRENVFLATKGGFLPFDGERPDDPSRYIYREFVEPGIVDREDLAAGQHCIAPEFIDDQLDRSLSNLGVDRVDLYYVHNPETQLQARSRADVYDGLEATFELLERRVEDDDIGAYGVATWDAFRVGDEGSHLSLPEVIDRAERAAEAVGHGSSHFEAIQLPFNVYMADAFTAAVHDGRSALEIAHEADVDVFTSASLMQGKLAREMPDRVEAELDGETRAQRAINFARSAPAVTSALVGMGSPDHVEENVAAGTYEPMGASAFDAIFE
ncbi:aldo/keto reductase [Halapricum hydrolyticum]|uniref:Aldo/keto reductase n=1 Tax=Halapricum hydrolyticum TaxID=2979991 RepID=A0AAE3IA42_9EURY|nr:aldo/keto reductase [Halapricum hydrolyticum]MCU4717551.1 aldo/keto reductase [Halapricum hydrolyticum]MCU4726715.1 aldo/keto reductase [Halapricum hydrolyticum]